MTPVIQIDPRDSVATALRDLDAGEQLLGVTLAEPVAKGHKFALRAIEAGAPGAKVGVPNGPRPQDNAPPPTRAPAPGSHVHTHNVATALEGSGSYSYRPEHNSVPLRKQGPKVTSDVAPGSGPLPFPGGRSFLGFSRP